MVPKRPLVPPPTVLKLEHRLTRPRDFAAVYACKKSWADGRLVLYVRTRRDETAKRGGSGQADTGTNEASSALGKGKPTETETRRFGFSVSKRVGKAHVRNRIKRRLREIVRALRAAWTTGNPGGFDAIWVARNPAASATFAELAQSAQKLLARGGILAQPMTPHGGQESMETVAGQRRTGNERVRNEAAE